MKNKTFASLEKALDILDLFDLTHREFSAQEISSRLDIPLSSTYKYLDVLVRRQLLMRKAGTKKVGIGAMLFRLGNVFSKDLNLVDIAMPHLENLATETCETAMITVVEGNEAICLERVEPQRLITFSLDPGRKLPLYVGASSRILLAYQNEKFIDSYLKNLKFSKFSNKTIASVKKLRAELKKTRDNGYVVTDSEADADAKAISAPIFDHKKNIIAGLTIAGPSERIKAKKLQDLIKLVKNKARKISINLGYLDSTNNT